MRRGNVLEVRLGRIKRLVTQTNNQYSSQSVQKNRRAKRLSGNTRKPANRQQNNHTSCYFSRTLRTTTGTERWGSRGRKLRWNNAIVIPSRQTAAKDCIHLSAEKRGDGCNILTHFLPRRHACQANTTAPGRTGRRGCRGRAISPLQRAIDSATAKANQATR